MAVSNFDFFLKGPSIPLIFLSFPPALCLALFPELISPQAFPPLVLSFSFHPPPAYTGILQKSSSHWLGLPFLPRWISEIPLGTSRSTIICVLNGYSLMREPNCANTIFGDSFHLPQGRLFLRDWVSISIHILGPPPSPSRSLRVLL